MDDGFNISDEVNSYTKEPCCFQETQVLEADHSLISHNDNFQLHSLANESLDCQNQTFEVLFNLHKKVNNIADGEKVEVINMGRLLSGFCLYSKKIDAQGYKGYSCRFWQALEHTGIRRSDPRLQDIVISMNEINRDAMASDDLELNEREFKRYLTICDQIAEKS